MRQRLWLWVKRRAGIKEGQRLPDKLLRVRRVLFPLQYLHWRWDEHHVPFATWSMEKDTVHFHQGKGEGMTWSVTMLTNTIPKGLYLLRTTGNADPPVIDRLSTSPAPLPSRQDILQANAQRFWSRAGFDRLPPGQEKKIAFQELVTFFRDLAADEGLRANQAEQERAALAERIAEMEE